MWGLHLNFLQLKITSLLMRAPEGNEARERQSTVAKGEASVGDGFGVAGPLGGLCNINVSQFELTWERGY